MGVGPPWATHGPRVSRLQLWAAPEVPRALGCYADLSWQFPAQWFSGFLKSRRFNTVQVVKFLSLLLCNCLCYYCESSCKCLVFPMGLAGS